jgi:hypothetical protein
MMFRKPVSLIQKLFESLERRDKKIATYHSISVAKIANIFNGEVDPNLLLPFDPNEDEKTKVKKSKILEPETVEIIKRLIKEKKLPHHIYPVLEPWSNQIYQ